MEPHFDVFRMYGYGPPTADATRLLHEHDINLKIILGAWIEPEFEYDDERNRLEPIPEHIAANAAQVEGVIRLANEYPDVVVAVLIGNESQIFWAAHRSDTETLARHMRRVRESIDQPMSTADLWNWWNTPEADPIAELSDFACVHAYAMWTNQRVPQAMDWTRDRIDDVRRVRPDMPLFIGELGWATTKHDTGDAGRFISGTADEQHQELFYHAWRGWAEQVRLPFTWFQAFDEKWKGGPLPNEVEKHWGLWNSDRTPKLAVRAARDRFFEEGAPVSLPPADEPASAEGGDQ